MSNYLLLLLVLRLSSHKTSDKIKEETSEDPAGTLTEETSEDIGEAKLDEAWDLNVPKMLQ
jgi:hypothetical protein